MRPVYLTSTHINDGCVYRVCSITDSDFFTPGGPGAEWLDQGLTMPDIFNKYTDIRIDSCSNATNETFLKMADDDGIVDCDSVISQLCDDMYTVTLVHCARPPKSECNWWILQILDETSGVKGPYVSGECCQTLLQAYIDGFATRFGEYNRALHELLKESMDGAEIVGHRD